MTDDSGVSAVERALSLLDAFNELDYSLTLAELARRTGLYKSTILRLSESLQRMGYLKRLADGSFQIGAVPLRLGAIYQRQCRTSEHVPEVLREIVQATEECASFYIQDDKHAVCLHRVDSARMIRDAIREGDRLPISKGAAPQVLQAFGTHKNGKRYDRIRIEGFCASFGESDPEIAALSVPVLSVNRALVGALTLSGPRYRYENMDTSRMLNALFIGARKLTKIFGGDPEWIGGQ
jgi:DNA-binding IclR family transcriptional regulator